MYLGYSYFFIHLILIIKIISMFIVVGKHHLKQNLYEVFLLLLISLYVIDHGKFLPLFMIPNLVFAEELWNVEKNSYYE